MDALPALKPAVPSPAPPTPARVLIVDDEERICRVYQRLLAAPEREISACGSGREAIDRMHRQSIDLLILDLNLPDISGHEVMEWLNAHRSGTAVLVFSADDRIDAAIRAQRLGSQGFLRKQADPEEIVALVEAILRRRRIEREHAAMSRHLEHSERMHRFLVEHSPDIIYTLDDAGCFVFINHRIESLLGYSNEELLGQHYSVLVHEDDREQVRYAFAERRCGKRATFNHELRLRCKNHDVRNFENRMVVALLCSKGIYRDIDDDKGADYIGTAGVLRDITERKRAEETIAYQAFHDLLTGLPNRSLFKDRLELAINQARRNGQRVGLMYLDIDRFKQVNDTYGHAEGDELLRNFAHRVRNCLRAGDTLARQGGDEFSVLLPELTGSDAALTIARKIMSELDQPFRVAGGDLRSSASIGIAIYPEDGECAETLLRNADAAMYQIKTRGRNGFVEYARGMGADQAVRDSVEHDLRAALTDRQFELHFQPQISLSRRQVIGVEALIRWNHPTRGLVGPNDFIPLAEACGLIFEISDWVLDEACRHLARWMQLGRGEWTLAVNISPVEFERPDFIERVMRPVTAHGIDPQRLDIEITENLLMSDAERVIGKVAALRQCGLHVSIDDFGTRYSSLNYLRRFHVNCVKIDQSFVRDIEDAAAPSPVIEAIVGIANGFALDVLAEGVETMDQVHALRRLGCDEMQGFHFSRPLPAPALEAFLDDHAALHSRYPEPLLQ